MKKPEEKMVALVKANRPGLAIDVWLKFPAAMRTPETDTEIGEIVARRLSADFTP